MDTFWADPAKATLAIVAVLGILGGIGVFIFKAGRWVSSVDKDREGFGNIVGEINLRLGEILEILSKISRATVTEKSPVQLNELGEVISKELDASGWAKRTAPGLVAQIEGKQPYEVQKFSFDCVKGDKAVLTESMEIKVEISAYDHGLIKGQILDVLAVELRDELLRLLATN